MFEYQEPEASDNQETNPGTGSLPLPPGIGGQGQGTRSLNPEKVRHMLFGSLAGIDRTIKILHALGYADPNDWSDPIPAPPGTAIDDATQSLRLRSATESAGAASLEGMPRSSSGVETPAVSGVELWMAILTKTVLIE
ncbi:hypothetical protein C7293_12335 [filamentous cyanobacterium CCT1]|nr:hypothetical protein C7293_12335 [filamentous cyanobacterium CCT1]PSN76621.1 hypothetical protein C8B47_26370 [filamentous cyanobacterium CCP4]